MTPLPHWLPERWRQSFTELAKMPLGRRLVRGAALSVVMTGVSVVLGLANSVLLGRALGPQHYGLYSFVLILVSIATVPFWHGMSTLLTREVGRLMAGATRVEMGQLLRWSFERSVLASLAIIIVAAILIWLFAGLLGPERTSACLVGLPLITLTILQPLNSTLLRGVGGLVRSQFTDLVFRPALGFALLVAAATVLRQAFTAQSALIATAVSVLAAAGLSGYWLMLGWLSMPMTAAAGARVYSPGYRLRNLAAFSAYAGVAALNSSIDSLLLEGMRGDAALGVYRIAMTAVQLVASIVAAVNTISQPSIATLHAAGDIGRLQRLLTWNARVTLLLAASPVAVLVLFGAPLLRLVFGEPFAAGAPAMAIGALGQLIATLAGPVWNVLLMTGHERVALTYALAGLLTNFVVCALLIPAFGMTGAAFGSAAGSIVCTGMMAVNEHRLTRLNSSVFGAR